MYRNILVVVFFSLLLSGCLQSPYYQHQEAIPKNDWQYSFQPTFTFSIDDITLNYNTDFLIRHTDAYAYSNIWLLMHIKKPGETTFEDVRVNLALAEPGGKWLGRGMGEIWEQRVPVTLPIIFDKKGTYEIKIEQNMRLNPLPEILNVGLSVEKAGPRNAK